MNFEFVLTGKDLILMPRELESAMRLALVEFEDAYRYDDATVQRWHVEYQDAETWEGYFPAYSPRAGLNLIACLIAIKRRTSRG